MTKDLVDAMKDLQSAEVKFNKGEPAIVNTVLKSGQAVKTRDGDVVAVTSNGEAYNVTKVVKEMGKEAGTKKSSTKKADKPHQIVEIPKPSKEDRIAELLTNFCVTCGHMDIVDRGNGHVKHYPRPEAWKYLADLCGTYTRVEDTHYAG